MAASSLACACLIGWGVRRQFGKRLVGITSIEILELLQHLLRQLLKRMGDAELCGCPDQGGLRVADGGEGLVEIGRHLSEIAAFGLRRQAQRGADLMDIRHRLRHLRLRFRQDRLPSIIFLPAYRFVRQQLLRACEFQLCQA